jgi:hypothetical protein
MKGMSLSTPNHRPIGTLIIERRRHANDWRSKKTLGHMRLHGMAQTLQAPCLQAQRRRHPSVPDVLTQLVQNELDVRQSRLIERRLSVTDSMIGKSSMILTGHTARNSPKGRFLNWSASSLCSMPTMRF